MSKFPEILSIIGVKNYLAVVFSQHQWLNLKIISNPAIQKILSIF